jgi:hypothetical protein
MRPHRNSVAQQDPVAHHGPSAVLGICGALMTSARSYPARRAVRLVVAATTAGDRATGGVGDA